MQAKIREYIKQHHMLEKGDRIVLGVSGGADSVCLLALLAQLREEYELSLYVVHVNHKIRTEAPEDAAYVRMLCEQYEIPFYLYEKDIPAFAAESGMTVEEAGREYRYTTFWEVLQFVGANKLATAHHMGDQVETLLFHLVRGSDLAGMKGILPVKELQKGVTMIRPLLCCQKQELVDWLKQNEMVWMEDVTNQDNHYARNKIRNEIVPLLLEVNARAVDHMIAFADSVSKKEAYFQKMVQMYMREHVCLEEDKRQACVNRQILLKEDSVFIEAILYEMLCAVARKRKDILRVHIQALYDLLSAQSGKKIVLPYQIEADVSYEKIWIRQCLQKEIGLKWEDKVIPIEDGEIALNQNQKLLIKIIDKKNVSKTQWEHIEKEALNAKNIYTKVFDCDTINDTLCVRQPQSGDYFVMDERGSRKKLSRYFIDCKMPQEQRRQQLVVAAGTEILWLIGKRRCNNHKISDTTTKILWLSYEGENDGKSN